MAKDYTQLANTIVDLVGGKDNVNSLYHCITRLRFDLKNESIATNQKQQIEALPEVISVIQANNQFQVVIGNQVDAVYDTIDKIYHFANPVESGESDHQSLDGEKQQNIIIRFFNIISSIFNPIIMPLAGAGMIKALLVLLTSYNLLSADASTYKIISAAGNSVFYFLPLFLAVSAGRVFKVNAFIALAIVGALLEPNFTGLVTGNGVTVDFMGIPAILMSYSGTVIPAIIAIYIYSHLEKILKKIVPKSLEIFLLPMIALLIMVPLTVLVIGPIGVTLGNGLGDAMNFMSEKSGLLAGLIIGGAWTLLVMVGVHWGVVPIMVNNISVYGYDIIRPMIAAATFASAGAALGVFLRAKNKDTKALALSSLVPALLGGITEPIVYGLAIKFRKPLYAMMIGGGIAGAFLGLMKTKAIVYVFPALTTLPAFYGDTFGYYLIGITIAFFLTAVIAFILGIDETVDSSSNSSSATAELIGTADNSNQLIKPFTGQLIPLEEAKDEVFSTKVMGDGFAIIPSDGTLYSPVTGKVTTVFPTKHAIGIESDTGLEVLIHIGIDTVELQGQGFNLTIAPNDYIFQGQVIGQVDFDSIKLKGYDTTTMVVITNSNENTNYHLPII